MLRRSESTVEQTAEAIAASMALPLEFEPITVGGAEGVAFGGDTPESATDALWGGFGAIPFNRGETWRFWIVDVDSEVVTFALFSTKNDVELYLPMIQEVVDSVVWKDLS
ncbi:MAG: hypothetical protein EX269_06060 [Acidimicrobiales bacterium]|nr:MAG: hypothetical protein EX269_06060 [Acidimicrobiales bacterium]